MVQASWVISKITGTISNGSQLGNSIELDSPNYDPDFQPFREGRLANDNTHIAKVLWAYQAPWDINLSGAYFYTSGSTYTRVVRFTDLNQATTDILAEPRGSRRLDGQPKFDFKAEKRFRLATGHLGVSFEAFNLFNNGAVNDRFHADRRQLRPAAGTGIAAATARRSDLPLLIATAVRSEARFSFERRAFSSAL